MILSFQIMASMLGISQSTLHLLPHHVLSILAFQMILKLAFFILSIIILFQILLPQPCLLTFLNGFMMASNWMMTLDLDDDERKCADGLKVNDSVADIDSSELVPTSKPNSKK